MPCPDELLPLPSHELAQQAVVTTPPEIRWIVVSIVALAVTALLLDLWLKKKHKLTISNMTRKGPKWFQVLVAGGLTGLIWHLFFQGNGKDE